MNVLIIGGNRFVGYLLVWRLLARRDRVTIINRGSIPDPFGDRVERFKGDRNGPELATLLAQSAERFDAVVDFAAFERSEIEKIVAQLRTPASKKPHYVFISTGQVYLVRQGAQFPAKESDYDGPLVEKPSTEPDLTQWTYGAGKRGCEDALFEAAAKHDFTFTTFRIPMVNGARDHFRRLEGYLYRLLDGGPLVLPGGGAHRVRHVYGTDVACAIAEVLTRQNAFGKAYNLSQDEQPTLTEVLEMLARHLGSTLRTVDVPRDEVIGAGLEPSGISPFSGLWMSKLDPALAKSELGFAHCPVDQYLRAVVESFLANPPAEPPEMYKTRSQELELARRFGA